MLEISLIAIILLVLFLPISSRRVEENLEVFLFIMGLAAISCAHFFGGREIWSTRLLCSVFTEPLMITAAVFAAGLVLLYSRRYVLIGFDFLQSKLGKPVLVFWFIILLGLASSFITAIMAAIIFAELIPRCKFPREVLVKTMVYGCFSIGLGAVLTPLGEPLSTISTAQLRAEPFHADFFFLARHLGAYVVPAIVLMGFLGWKAVKANAGKTTNYDHAGYTSDSLGKVFFRAAKVYLFIMALVLLGQGFKPVVDKYISHISGGALYWINIISAAMDNATLAAAQITPLMSLEQIRYALMGLLIAGGILIPGNIPNIIVAGRLSIGSKEWAKQAIPLGLILMLGYFVVLFLFSAG